MSLNINGEVISDDVIHYEFNHIKKQYEHLDVKTPDDKNLLILVKENLTRKTVLRQEAEGLDLEVDKVKISEEIAAYKKRNPLMREKDQAKLHSYLINQLKINHLIDQVVKDISPPEERHIAIFFEENKGNYFVKKGYDFIEIGVGKDSAGNSGLKKKMILLKNHFVKSVDYQEKVKNYLGEKSYSKEWKLFKKDNLNPLVREKLNHLAVGQTTMVNEEEKAFYFLYLEKIYQDHWPLLHEVKNQVQRDLVFELEERKIDIFVRKLISKSKVIDDHYL